MILIKLSAFIGSNYNNSYTCFVSHAYSKYPGVVYLGTSASGACYYKQNYFSFVFICF